VYSGNYITKEIRVSVASSARNYNKTDVDSVSGSCEFVEAKWLKIFSDATFEVSNIDISNARGRGGTNAVVNLFQDAMETQQSELWELVYENCMAQVKLDLLASGTYSAAALNRTTYPTLAPYNEVTVTPITVALTRGLMYGTDLNKKQTPRSARMLTMEPSVYNKFSTAAQLLNSWVINDAPAGVPQSVGWQPIGNFEGAPLGQVQGMTTGDVLYARKVDMRYHQHRPLVISVVPSGRDSVKGIMRLGINAYVLNPGLNGMMTNKG
jgi:hypothetical protein